MAEDEGGGPMLTEEGLPLPTWLVPRPVTVLREGVLTGEAAELRKDSSLMDRTRCGGMVED